MCTLVTLLSLFISESHFCNNSGFSLSELLFTAGDVSLLIMIHTGRLNLFQNTFWAVNMLSYIQNQIFFLCPKSPWCMNFCKLKPFTVNITIMLLWEAKIFPARVTCLMSNNISGALRLWMFPQGRLWTCSNLPWTVIFFYINHNKGTT